VPDPGADRGGLGPRTSRQVPAVRGPARRLSLTITYIVNSRSYLIREGHYQLGWHAVPHMLQFILLACVGPQSMASTC
jgi:hypothetical protein